MLNYEFTDDERKMINQTPDYSKLTLDEIIDYSNSQKKLITKLSELASRDPLTELYNVSAVRSKIQERLSKSDNIHKHYVFFVDIDNFKSVNDKFGHLFGDSVLSGFAHEIYLICNGYDSIIGRIGGDEFIIFLSEIELEKAEAIAKNICNAFDNICNGNLCDEVSCSIGISQFPNDSTNYTVLKEYADKALYRSKRRGKNCFTIFDKDVDLKSVE